MIFDEPDNVEFVTTIIHNPCRANSFYQIL